LEDTAGYQFRMDEGLKALARSQAARRNLFSGRAGKEVLRYSQGLASDEYANEFGRLARMAYAGVPIDWSPAALVGSYGQNYPTWSDYDQGGGHGGGGGGGGGSGEKNIPFDQSPPWVDEPRTYGDPSDAGGGMTGMDVGGVVDYGFDNDDKWGVPKPDYDSRNEETSRERAERRKERLLNNKRSY